MHVLYLGGSICVVYREERFYWASCITCALNSPLTVIAVSQ